MSNLAPNVISPASPRPRWLVALHWLTLAMLLLGLAAIAGRELAEGRALRASLLDLHRHCGLFVLALCVWRLTLRWRLGALPPLGDAGPTQRRAAACVHSLLYLLLVAMPVSGWLLSAALGQPAGFLGLQLPNPVGADEDLADGVRGVHITLAITFGALVTMHAAAALWHHFVKHDGVLIAMGPQRGLGRMRVADPEHRSTQETT